MMSSIVDQLCFKSVASILYSLRQHDSILLSGLSKHLAHSHHRWQYHHFLRLKSSSGWQAECSAAHQPFFYSSHKAALLQSWSAAKLILYRDDIHWRSIMSTYLLSNIFKKLIFKFIFSRTVFRFILPELIIEKLQGRCSCCPYKSNVLSRWHILPCRRVFVFI